MAELKSRNNLPDIPEEKFRFAQLDEELHDNEFETKPVGYFKDAWLRFRKNKASIAGALIIILLVLFAVIVPYTTKYTISSSDGEYVKMRPKSTVLAKLGIWDGTYEKKLNDRYYIYLNAIGMGILDTRGTGNVTWSEGEGCEFSPIKKLGELYSSEGKDYRNASVDSYDEVGFRYLSLNQTQMDDLLAWEKESGVQVVYPMIDTGNQWCDPYNQDDANYWYKHDMTGAPVDAQGNRISIKKAMAGTLSENYLRNKDGSIALFRPLDKSMMRVRVLYRNYFIYKNGYEPVHLFGTDTQGYDIYVRLAHGLRLSLILAFAVSLINFLIGTVYGAIEGYCGGAVDLVMERFTDILNGMPFIVIATLLQVSLVQTGKMSTIEALLFAFVFNGWIGIAYRVRTQFYRFKKQEYVLAARTLGAGHTRLMFKHIYPNALGTIITTTILIIPEVIFSESILSYLGIANFNGSKITSLGTLLSNGQSSLATHPHIILFPAIAISLLMISFNLFGNGLRDAFNPSLRGADE